MAVGTRIILAVSVILVSLHQLQGKVSLDCKTCYCLTDRAEV